MYEPCSHHVPDSIAAGPFRRSDAEAAGVSDYALRGDAFTRIRRDDYVHACVPQSDSLDARAWMAVMPDGAAMYGASAARWYGLPVAPTPDFHVIVPGGGTVPRRRPGLITHEGVRSEEVVVVRGLPVTSPARTWLDLSLSLRRHELVAVGDAMVRADLVKPNDLIEAARNARGRRGIVRTRKISRLIRAGVDSTPESHVRLLLCDDGLPEPEVNLEVFDAAGGWIGRPDLAYLNLKVAIQYEGDIHRTDQKRWRADVARDEVFRENGWEVVRLTASDLRHPARLCARVRSARARQQQRLGLA